MPASQHEQFAIAGEYVARQRALPADHGDADVAAQLRRCAKLVPIGAGSSLYELGAGSGWLLIGAAKRGLRCAGVEHNPGLAELALARARAQGVEIAIAVGDAATHPIAAGAYDVVVANSVLEHVPDHRAVIANAYRALRPGGLFCFNSTNKFALRSGEYPGVPLYGWLPYRARAAIRVRRQGRAIIASGGIDFHQFTHPGLRRTLHQAGFQRVIDLYELLDPADLNRPTPARALALRACRRLPPLKALATTFAAGTHFYCLK